MTVTYENRQRAHSGPSISPLSVTASIIGRQRELTVIMDHYESAKGEHVRVVLVTGETGIGKTRLMNEIAQYATHNGAIVL